MSTKLEVPLQSELTECLVNARHWLLCMGANLIGDICRGLGSPSLSGKTCQLQIVFAMCYVQFSSVQLLSHVRFFATPWTTACQGSLFFTNSWSFGKVISIELVIPSNHFILCHPLLPLPSIFPSNRVFSNESVLHISCSKYWRFNISINPSNEYSGLISFKMTGWISLQSKGLSRVLSNTIVQNH